MLRSRSALAFASVALLLALATAVGLVVLWPDGSRNEKIPQATQLETEEAVATDVRDIPCQDPFTPRCANVDFRLESGPDEGLKVTLPIGDPVPDVGDRVRLFKIDAPPELEGQVDFEPYAFSDFERRMPMLWLAVAFAAAVIVTGRWRGLRALIGLGASLAVVLFFIVPAILDGRSPLGVAVVGSLAVMFVTMALAHGVGPKTLAASLGTAASLALIVGLAVLSTKVAHLTGFSSEEASFLRVNVAGLSIEGLVLAGMVIAALGVLDDVTVSQAATVLALRQANPAQGFALLFRRAISVGRDHIAATVNTLVLAYVGASLPVLLVFVVGNTPFATAVNGEVVAENVIATLVGSIGLVAAVPTTTALAALLATRLPPRALPHEAHGHVH